MIASKKAQGAPEVDSVFDFLFHDSRRIGSFLAQFDENGLLTGLRQTDSATKGTRRGFKVELGASTPITGGGNIGFERGPGESGAQAMERAYDPFWANAREFLDALEARNMIQRDIKSARIGQFVLVSGSLIISDLKMLQAIWPLPMVQKAMVAGAAEAANRGESATDGNRQQRLAQAAKDRKSAPKGVPDEIKMVMELLPHLPHSGQFHLVGDEFAVWAPASEDSLVGSMSDLLLKHGAKIGGTWNMLGILDALPYEEDQNLTLMEMLQVGLMSDGIAKISMELPPLIRLALGRPVLSYGMTPLLVFREVSI